MRSWSSPQVHISFVSDYRQLTEDDNRPEEQVMDNDLDLDNDGFELEQGVQVKIRERGQVLAEAGAW